MIMAAKRGIVRCFVAIEIPQSIQKSLQHMQTCLNPEIRKASWTKFGNFHLTLKFLGDVHAPAVEGVGKVMQSLAAVQSSFSIEFGKIGAFPNLSRPRVLWVGVKHGAPTVSRLASVVNLELRHLGFAIDKRFHPHLTVARLRAPMNLKPLRDMLQRYDTIDGALMNVNEMTLMQSRLHPNGAVYTPLNLCHFST